MIPKRSRNREGLPEWRTSNSSCKSRGGLLTGVSVYHGESNVIRLAYLPASNVTKSIVIVLLPRSLVSLTRPTPGAYHDVFLSRAPSMLISHSTEMAWYFTAVNVSSSWRPLLNDIF